MSRAGLGFVIAGLVGAAAVGSVLATLLAQEVLANFAPPMRLALEAAMHAGMALVILVPIGLVSHRQVERLCRNFEDVGTEGTGSVSAPFWLRPVASALTEAVRSWVERYESLTTRLREVEIRQRLSEAERDHAVAILNSLRDGVLVTDGFDELSVANLRAAELLGFRVDDAIHKPIDEIIEDGRLRTLIKEVRTAGVLNKQKNVEHEMAAGTIEHPSAEFDVTLACLPDVKNEVGGVVTILRDVTREREISQMKSDFVSQASHELRTPLSSINAYVEMLLDGEAEDDAARTEFYQIIKGEADRVSRMIDNMLNISRIEAGVYSIERVETDFVAVCRDVVDTMQAQAKTKDIKLGFKHGPLVYTAEADRDMVHQVVMNLVSNAVKYTPEGGRVTVTVENDDTSRSVMVTVADTGLGIPPEALARIFEKFYRIENYKRVAKGTGLGLNLVKHIVETVHAGQVQVESEMGMGSRFWFTIPYERAGR